MLIFDSRGTGGIPVRSLKVFFVLMCEGRLRDKFLYLFRHFSDHASNTLSRLGLTALLGAISQAWNNDLLCGSKMSDHSVK